MEQIEANNEESSLDPVDLDRAREGVKKFEEVLAGASKGLREVLLSEKLGEELQAMFLGVKPATYYQNDNPFEKADLDRSGLSLEDLASQLSGVFEFKAEDEDSLIYDPKQVENAISESRKVVDFFKDTPVEAGRFISKKPLTGNQIGILVGYPIEAVINGSALRRMRDGTLPPTTTRKTQITAPGFIYAVTDPALADGKFPKKINYLFEASGMNNLVQSRRAKVSSAA